MAMPWLELWVVPSLLAGILVAACAKLAAVGKRQWSGFLAAAPITPTLAVLQSSHLEAQDLALGIPTVAAATTCLALGYMARAYLKVPGTPWLVIVGVPPLLWFMSMIDVVAQLALIVVLCLAVGAPPSLPGFQSVRKLDWWKAGLAGAIFFVVLLAVIAFSPAAAPWVATYPALLLISLLVTQLGQGRMESAALAKAALPASAGVAAFLGATAWISVPGAGDGVHLLVGWAAYAAIALVWPPVAKWWNRSLPDSCGCPGCRRAPA